MTIDVSHGVKENRPNDFILRGYWRLYQRTQNENRRRERLQETLPEDLKCGNRRWETLQETLP